MHKLYSLYVDSIWGWVLVVIVYFVCGGEVALIHEVCAFLKLL